MRDFNTTRHAASAHATRWRAPTNDALPRAASAADSLPQGKSACACGGGCPRCQSHLPVQTNPTVSQPGDRDEREAERVAEEVTRSRAPTVPIAAGHASASDHPVGGLGQGRPLDEESRAFFEPRFGRDLGGVRVHTGARADESARAFNALAYTAGADVVFAAGQYAPETAAGRWLLAHELAHVAQQGGRNDGIIRRYTKEEIEECPCLAWPISKMLTFVVALIGAGELSGRHTASKFLEYFLKGRGRTIHIPFPRLENDPRGAEALKTVNERLSNFFLEEAEGLECGAARDGVVKRLETPVLFKHGTDLYYAMGISTLVAWGNGRVDKQCNEEGGCTRIGARFDIKYSIDDPYDWKSEIDGCTPATGEDDCIPNMKPVPFSLPGDLASVTICDECLNRLVIHKWAYEFMVKIRGRADGYSINGPCGFRNPTVAPVARDNHSSDQ